MQSLFLFPVGELQFQTLLVSTVADLEELDSGYKITI